jgi:uncharacterized protein
MMRVILLCTLLAVVSARGALAEVVTGLYSASVPVADQSAKALAVAARQALSEVLVKVSGSTALLENAAITSALGEARNQVQQYSYARGEKGGPPLLAEFVFEGAYVNSLVTRAGAPLWTANRPQVLAWVVFEDAQGRRFISWDGTPEQAKQLTAEFSRRGVPLQLPVFDLGDMAALTPDVAWELDEAAIRNASARYNVQDVLAGRLAPAVDGKAMGEWRYFFQENRIEHPVTVPDLQVFLRDGVNVVASEMSARYAVAPTAGVEGGVLVSVSGIASYADYAALVNWLKGLEPVQHANLERVQGDRVDLRLQARADAAKLGSIIELNSRLQPSPDAGAGAQLNYQWLK